MEFIPRNLAQNLSEAQRAALSEFYVGHISAGEFSRRIGGLTTQAAVPQADSQPAAADAGPGVAWGLWPAPRLSPAPEA